jgi:hypothetical protein
MPQQFLDGPNIMAGPQQIRGKRMACQQRLATDRVARKKL